MVLYPQITQIDPRKLCSLWIVLLLSLSVVTGCSRSATVPSLQQSASKVDACAMLTSQEIESVQGETLKDTKLSESSADGLKVSQCFFTLPTFTNSISLVVTQRAAGAGARDPRQFWRDTFHRDEEKEEEGESRPPQKISGIGDEAFWMTSPAAGILYVLKGSSFIRISIGGREDPQTRINKSKALAQKVLDRL